MFFLLMIVFLGASTADFAAKKKRGYFNDGRYGKWVLQRTAILAIVLIIWFLAIRGV